MSTWDERNCFPMPGGSLSIILVLDVVYRKYRGKLICPRQLCKRAVTS